MKIIHLQSVDKMTSCMLASDIFEQQKKNAKKMTGLFLDFNTKSIFRTNMWKEGAYILFECIVEETGKPCLTGGWIKLSQDLETEVFSGNNSIQQGLR